MKTAIANTDTDTAREPMRRSLTKNPQQKILRVPTSENPLIDTPVANTPVGAFGVHLHGELPLREDLDPKSFTLEGKKRLILFRISPCSANNHSDPSIRLMNDLFKNFFNNLLRESNTDNINQEIYNLKNFLSRERIKYGIETAYTDLKYFKEAYDDLLKRPLLSAKEKKHQLKYIEKEMINTYINIKYILEHPEFLVDINVYDDRNPNVPNKHYYTTKEIMGSSTSYIEGTISAFNVSDTYSETKRPDTTTPTFEPLIYPPDGSDINLLTQIIREKKTKPFTRDYFTITNDDGINYHLTLKQLCDYYYDRGYTILIGYDASCNIFTRKDKVITRHADIVSATDRYVNNPEISHPLSAKDVDKLKEVIDQTPKIFDLEKLLKALEKEPYVNFLRPSKGGSQTIKNRKISKTTVKKRKGKKRMRRTKRQ